MKTIETSETYETYSNQKLWLACITLSDQLRGLKKSKKDLPDYFSELLPQINREMAFLLNQLNLITDEMNLRGI